MNHARTDRSLDAANLSPAEQRAHRIAQDLALLIQQRLDGEPPAEQIGATCLLVPALATVVLDTLTGHPAAQRALVDHLVGRITLDGQTREAVQ
jgi:hypothetical protein